MSSVCNVRKNMLAKRGIRSFQQWNMRSNTVYIGRDMSKHVPGAVGSKWGNPFSVKEYGREGCIAKYEEYLRSRPDLMAALPELDGMELGCWCHPQGCHGDVLCKVLKEVKEQKK
ncbi:protein of unknown function [Kipferlia bialata]|uniref:DUF4326 domain-containing protein n=1 Tax=Kipferlia bialata TaxID=797122 RepID=A0A9K3CNW5_9EUKA|nr:protein of unknown function [Kipferlia bialata]|eukprot:g716.t1